VSDLLEFVTEAHGGRELWLHASAVTASIDFHGGFFEARGQSDLLGPCEVTAALDRQYVSVRSAKSGHTIFFDGKQDRVIVTAQSGEVVENLEHARQSMLALAPLGPSTRWTAAQTGHFIGYALWTYLLEPYVFEWPGVATEELDEWHEDGDSWRRLQVTFPESLFTHERTQIYYFDARTGLQRRIDYTPAVTEGRPAAHYTFEHRYFGGIPVPSARRVLLRDDEGRADHYFSPIQLDVHAFAINP
jgi:hypothetical protein